MALLTIVNYLRLVLNSRFITYMPSTTKYTRILCLKGLTVIMEEKQSWFGAQVQAKFMIQVVPAVNKAYKSGMTSSRSNFRRRLQSIIGQIRERT